MSVTSWLMLNTIVFVLSIVNTLWAHRINKRTLKTIARMRASMKCPASYVLDEECICGQHTLKERRL